MTLARFLINKCMAGWLILFAILALLVPGPFTVLSPCVNYIMGGVIFIMMLTADAVTLGRVFSRPRALILGFVIKWVTVPLAAWAAASIVYAHRPQLAAGTIVDGSTPVAAGLAVRYGVKPERTKKAEPVLPLISALLLYAVVLGLFSKAAAAVRAHLDLMPVIMGTTCVLIIINLAVAYAAARAARCDKATSRTIMFDIGIYNSGLGAVVAAANFGPFAALPALINTIMNLIIGALLSSWLQHRPVTGRAGPVPGPAAADPERKATQL